MNSSRSIAGSTKSGFARLGALTILSSCLLLAAPSLASASARATSPWAAVLGGLAKSVNSVYTANYTLVETKNGNTTENETVTYAQDPAKHDSVLVTPKASFYLEGPKTLFCGSHGGKLICTTLPASMSGSMTDIQDVFAPGIIASNLNGLQKAAAASHGYALSDVKGSSLKPAVADSTCLIVTGPKGKGTYCASNEYGELTYSKGGANGVIDTVNITSYTANPPASTFAPPAGATVVTIPSMP